MQSLLEDLFDLIVAEPFDEPACEPFSFACIRPRATTTNRAKTGLNLSGAETNGSGMLRVEDEHSSHFFGFDQRVILAMVSFKSADRSKDGHPLMIIRSLQRKQFVQKILILDVDEARGHFGALERPADAEELPAFVVGQGSVGHAVESMRAEFDFVAKSVRAGDDFVSRIKPAHHVVETVDVFPHFARDAVPYSTRIFA